MKKSAAQESIDRLANGQFPPGTSGNPNGRPKAGSAALREALAKEGDAVAKIVIAKALAGDMGAARLILERIAPPLKASAEPVHFEIPAKATPLQIAAVIMTAAASGHMPAETAATLITAAGNIARIEETDDLRARLEALERAISNTNTPPTNTPRR